MNWRGILGIYAGLAIVLAGAWFWVQSSALWALGVVAAGVAVAAFGVAYLVMKRRGPRPKGDAKPARTPRAARSPRVSAAEVEEADSVAKTRMAAIAGRATGRSAVAEWDSEAANGAEPENKADAPAFTAPGQPAESLEITDAAEAAAGDAADLTGTRAWSATLGGVMLPGPITPAQPIHPESEIDVTAVPEVPEVQSMASPDADSFAPAPIVTPEPDLIAEAPSGTAAAAGGEAETDDALTDWEATEPAEDRTPVALDTLAGFPWTPRFIGIWAREVRFACPDDLRGAVVHWQRWADGQPAASPVIEEVVAEFNAMLDVWRECGAEIPGLSSDGWTAGQLMAEAAEDANLAALLPDVLRVRCVADH